MEQPIHKSALHIADESTEVPISGDQKAILKIQRFKEQCIALKEIKRVLEKVGIMRRGS